MKNEKVIQDDKKHQDAYVRFFMVAKSKINIVWLTYMDWDLSHVIPPYSEFKNLTIAEIDEQTENVRKVETVTISTSNTTEFVIDAMVSKVLSVLPGAWKSLGIFYPLLKALSNDIKSNIQSPQNTNMPPNNVNTLRQEIQKLESQKEALIKTIGFFQNFLSQITANDATLGNNLRQIITNLPEENTSFIRGDVQSKISTPIRNLNTAINEDTIPILKASITNIEQRIELLREEIARIPRG